MLPNHPLHCDWRLHDSCRKILQEKTNLGTKPTVFSRSRYNFRECKAYPTLCVADPSDKAADQQNMHSDCACFDLHRNAELQSRSTRVPHDRLPGAGHYFA